MGLSLSLEMIKILFSLNFYNFRYSAYSGNRNFVCGVYHIVSFYNIKWYVCDVYTICVC
jgi:hypothetical protein